ncbi:hypothetical protein C0Q70_02839 [Pomacea canaliculata]|uniref:Arsenite methyltransferase n=1 Tax=Pomacea canaliculata TaxID=400727 RepID=A0A2T7PR54_POMCA|nr:arsenite methyltransferase-like [Pomacea canaliculata]PVD35870.1 hypothetical protein C0Q70_02839 [Pomacea canaliculata]
MSENTITDMVRCVYNTHNTVTGSVCRTNTENLLPEHIALFDQLSEEIKKSYYGTGIMIPEKLKGKRVLDVGCGSGSLVFILSKLVGPTGYVVGVDLSEMLIEIARSQVDYHRKAWGYDTMNCEFVLGNVENLPFPPESFDIVVSSGVISMCPDKEAVFAVVHSVLKEGGQFLLSDVCGEDDIPEECRSNDVIWTCGLGGLRWDRLAEVASKTGFTRPHLRQAAPVDIAEEYVKMIENSRFTCAGWRLFKLPEDHRYDACRVTYKGNIPEYSDQLPWDIDLTFKKGQGVDVDGELTTLLSTSYLRENFDFADTNVKPVTKRNQNPFAYLDKLQSEGRLPPSIFKVE